jgi:hypothetical protein
VGQFASGGSFKEDVMQKKVGPVVDTFLTRKYEFSGLNSRFTIYMFTGCVRDDVTTRGILSP